MSRRAIAPALLRLAAGCADPEALDGPWRAGEVTRILSLELRDASPPPSPGNRFADDPAAAELGRRLFFDPGLSRRGTLSCASCHRPELYFTDGLARARGGASLPHNTPTSIGVAFFPFLNWDGRRDSVWAQSGGPIEHPRELDRSRTGAAHHLLEHYEEAYEAVFGPLPPLEDGRRFPPEAAPWEGPARRAEREGWAAMSEEDRRAVNRVYANTGKALEAFQRRLLPRRSPFDRYAKALRDGDPEGGGHLSVRARRGLRLFIGEAGCFNCHHGPLLTDRQFHNLGLPLAAGQPDPLRGRAAGARLVQEDPFRCGGDYSDTDDCAELRFLDPAFEDFLGAFRTPGLRNVAKTAPYMHAGQLASLDEVVAFYRGLPGQPVIGHRPAVLRRLSPRLPLGDLVHFLRALSGPLPSGWDATLDAPNGSGAPPAGEQL